MVIESHGVVGFANWVNHFFATDFLCLCTTVKGSYMHYLETYSVLQNMVDLQRKYNHDEYWIVILDSNMEIYIIFVQSKRVG